MSSRWTKNINIRVYIYICIIIIRSRAFMYNNIRVYRRRYDTREICIEHDVYEVGREFLTVESRKKFGTTEAEKKSFYAVLRTIFRDVRSIYFILLLLLLLLFLIRHLRHTSLRVMYHETRILRCDPYTRGRGRKSEFQCKFCGDNLLYYEDFVLSCECMFAYTQISMSSEEHSLFSKQRRHIMFIKQTILWRI